ncbi:MAG: hypothetical protein IBV52_05695 [Candidatus Bathyarchaeota archaeon]
MTFKAQVLMYSSDGETWTVDERNFVLTDINPKTGKMFPYGEFFVEGVLKEGDVLIKRPGKPRR